MPELSRFYGLVIKMFFSNAEYNPPHFHVIYNDYVGQIDITTGEMIVGDLPVKALKLVREWLAINQKELLEIWQTQNFKKLSPLE